MFVGGQMSLDENGRVIGDDVATQAENAFGSLARVLAAAGADMADVVKHNVYFDCEDDDEAIAAFMAEIDRVRLAHFLRSGTDGDRDPGGPRPRGRADPGRGRGRARWRAGEG